MFTSSSGVSEAMSVASITRGMSNSCSNELGGGEEGAGRADLGSDVDRLLDVLQRVVSDFFRGN